MSDQKFCIQCGTTMDADAIFCQQCGARQDGAPVPPPKAAVPPQQYAPYQQPPYQQPVYQQPYPPQYPPYAAPPKKRGGGGLIVFLLILVLLAGAFYGVARYTQLLPESIQEVLPEFLQSESFDADEGEYIVDDDEDEDDNDDEDSSSKDDDKDTKSGSGLFGKSTEATETEEAGTETSTDNGSGDDNNDGIIGDRASKLTKDEIFGKWDGELTFTEIVMSDEEKATMSEEELAQMDSMLNKPMPLVFQFYKDDAGIYTTIGVITSPDFGESDMDQMFYDIIDGELVMSYADTSIEVVFKAAMGESNGTYAMDGTFSIMAIDGGGQSIKGVWNTSQTSTEVTLPE